MDFEQTKWLTVYGAMLAALIQNHMNLGNKNTNWDELQTFMRKAADIANEEADAGTNIEIHRGEYLYPKE